MVTFLFWNIGRAAVAKPLIEMVRAHQVDFVLLAECRLNPAEILVGLNASRENEFHYAPGIECDKIEVFSRFPRKCVSPFRETRRMTIRRVRLPKRQEFLLAAAHCISKRDSSGESQSHEAVRIAAEIRSAERDAGHERTLLVGDLNMNPFESGMVSALGLNAVMTRDIAARGARTIQDARYPFFYNPMWGLFGDRTPGAPGTHYYDRHEHVTYYWNLFDQVLVRPGLLPVFRSDGLGIVDAGAGFDLLSASGRPDSKSGSDHLPLVFRLDI